MPEREGVGGGRAVTTTTVGVPLRPEHEEAVITARRRAGVPLPVDETWTPHVSFLVLLAAPPLEQLDDILAEVAARTSPFTVRARGIGVFTGQDPDELVLHVPVVRSPEMESLHGALLTRVEAAGASVDGHYLPEAWFPHITLCRQVLTADELLEGVDSLLDRAPVSWDLPIESVARFDETGIPARFSFASAVC